jgi:hypothetical protein
MFDYNTKEKEHQNTRQSDLSCFDALSITKYYSNGIDQIYACLVGMRLFFDSSRIAIYRLQKNSTLKHANGEIVNS